jgi:hypothetical protein
MILRTGEVINIMNIPIDFLPVLTNTDAQVLMGGKGWSLPSVWDLLMLKRVYMTIFSNSVSTKQHVYQELLSKYKRSWKNPERVIDEYINALKCFDLIWSTESELKVSNRSFFDLKEKDKLTEHDCKSLGDLFFSYYRFKEIHNWFLKGKDVEKSTIDAIEKNDLLNKRPLLFYTSLHNIVDKNGKSREFADTFFDDINPIQLMQIEKANDKMMRFWDVFTNWGKTLNVIEKVNLTESIRVRCKLELEKRISVVYFVDDTVDFDLREFIDSIYEKSCKTISLPELSINIGLNYRCSIAKAHFEIISQTRKYQGLYSLQRTSQIFIAGKEYIYPKLGNSFVSHIIVR